MMKTTTLKRTGGSVSVILPKDMLERQHLGPDSQVHITERDGGIFISGYDPHLDVVMQAARQVMAEDRDGLRALADR